RDWYRMVRPGTGRFTMPSNGHPASPAPPTVLVVEDEADTNLLFCQLLEREGIACRGARDGGQALALAAAAPPAAILLDLLLPDRLRKAGPLKRPPVVVVTALDDESSRERGRRLGADAYLTKPFLPAALIEEFHEVLADSRG